jgi:hypothetical protein
MQNLAIIYAKFNHSMQNVATICEILFCFVLIIILLNHKISAQFLMNFFTEDQKKIFLNTAGKFRWRGKLSRKIRPTCYMYEFSLRHPRSG